MKLKINVLICLLSALIPFQILAQGKAVISGKAVDETGAPLPATNVLLQSTTMGAAANHKGEYEFTVAASAVRGQLVSIDAQFIGYRTQTKTIRLTPGFHTVDFSLSIDALDVDAIFVTGVVEKTPKAKMAFSVGRISSEILDKVPATSVESALQGKLAGVRVIAGSGQPGASASVLLRASTSINANGRSQDPLYIIDGVIIDPSLARSPLSDINAEDIENIEVVKGAAGASLYGSRAANGVVNIVTKRGSSLAINQTKIRIRNELGFNQLRSKYPVNQSHEYRIHEGLDEYVDANGIRVTPNDFIDNEGNFVDPRATAGRIGDRYTGNYDPDNPDPQAMAEIFFADKPYKWISTGDIVLDDNLNPVLDAATDQPLGLRRIPNGNFRNPLDQFYAAGMFMTSHISISRRMANTNFSISFSNSRDEGIVKNSAGSTRRTIRAALDHVISKSISLGVNGFFSRHDQDDVTGDSFFTLAAMAGDTDLTVRHKEAGTRTQEYPDGLPHSLGNELFLRPDPMSIRNNPLYNIYEAERTNHRIRAMGGLTLRYQPVHSFKLEGHLSYDRSNREQNLFLKKGFLSLSNPDEGLYSRSPENDKALNGNITASFQHSLFANELVIRAKAKALFERTDLRGLFVEGTGLSVTGVQDLNVADPLKISVDSEIQKVRSNGYSLILGLDYKDRYIGDFLIRRDGSSLFGSDERWHNYFRVSGAYRLSQEPWWFTDKIQEFKFRGSYGTAGGRPNFFSRFETWTVEGGNVNKGALGNKDLKPEFAKELETGLDMVFLDKFSLEITRAQTTVENQLLEVPLVAVYGYRSQWRNAGTLETNTWEFSLQGALIQRRDIALSIGFNLDRTRQTITKLDVPLFTWFGVGGPDIFVIQEGQAFGAMRGTVSIRTPESLLLQGVSDVELSQFQTNDDGFVVWVGDGNHWTEGISMQLWGTQGELSNGRTYDWGMPIRMENENGNQQFIVGSTVPDFNWSFFTNMRWKGFSFYGLLDAQVGGDVFNVAAWHNWPRSALVDQAGKPDELKKPTLYYFYRANVQQWVLDGSFIKLRELSLKYTIDRRKLRNLFGGILEKVSFGVVGRNLFSLDNYSSGSDPEVGVGGSFGGSAAVTRVDGFNYPNFRTFTGLVELEF